VLHERWSSEEEGAVTVRLVGMEGGVESGASYAETDKGVSIERKIIPPMYTEKENRYFIKTFVLAFLLLVYSLIFSNSPISKARPSVRGGETVERSPSFFGTHSTFQRSDEKFILHTVSLTSGALKNDT
jgi:hypothetical protein